LITRDTVARETPLSAANSSSVRANVPSEPKLSFVRLLESASKLEGFFGFVKRFRAQVLDEND
jgi:hypothetical protein